eukprot:3978394-Ditylum_brightwellii.AAC.1
MEALRIQREMLGDAYPHLASTLHLLGVLLTTMGELHDSMHYLLGASRIQRHVFDKKEKENVPMTTTTTNTTTTILDVIVNDASSTNNKENTESNPLVLNTKLAIGILGHDHHSVAETLRAIAAVCQDASEHEKAIDALKEPLQIYRESSLGGKSLEVAKIMSLLALSYLKLGQNDELDKLCNETLTFIETK